MSQHLIGGGIEDNLNNLSSPEPVSQLLLKNTWKVCFRVHFRKHRGRNQINGREELPVFLFKYFNFGEEGGRKKGGGGRHFRSLLNQKIT